MDVVKFCRENCVERRGTGTLKWDSLGEIFGEEDLTALWVADMEIKAPEQVTAALRKRAEHGVFGYGKVPDSYFEAYAAWQRRHHGMAVKKEELRFYTGVVGSLYTMVNTFTDREDAVVICPPVYYPFYDAVLNTGRRLVTCELDNHSGRYTLDTVKFEQKIAANGVKMFILCSPHNPVSRVWTKDELKAMFDVCKKYGVLIVADEIHQDFTYCPEHRFQPVSELSGGMYKDMLVVLGSGSKTFNLAGLIHSHVLIFDEGLRNRYDAYIKTIGQPEANIMGLAGVEAAFRFGDEWLQNVKEVILHNYAYLKDRFAKEAPGIKMSELEGTYLCWIDMRACMEPKKVAGFAQKKCRLAVDAGEWFSEKAYGFIRVNLATDPKYIEIAANSIISNLTEDKSLCAQALC